MVAMSRTGGTKELASILDEAVVWQGLLPELVCNGRGEVLNILGRAHSRLSPVSKPKRLATVWS